MSRGGGHFPFALSSFYRDLQLALGQRTSPSRRCPSSAVIPSEHLPLTPGSPPRAALPGSPGRVPESPQGSALLLCTPVACFPSQGKGTPVSPPRISKAGQSPCRLETSEEARRVTAVTGSEGVLDGAGEGLGKGHWDSWCEVRTEREAVRVKGRAVCASPEQFQAMQCAFRQSGVPGVWEDRPAPPPRSAFAQLFRGTKFFTNAK